MTNFIFTFLSFLSLFAVPESNADSQLKQSESVLFEESDLVITEIMYDPNSSESAWEWVEVYNKGTQPIDLTGYVFDDNNSIAQVASNITTGSVAPLSTVILFDAEITVEEFKAVWGDVNAIAVAGWPGLNNTGDTIAIWENFEAYVGDNMSQLNVIEQVIYDDNGDWPDSNNSGSIFLVALDSDNSLGASWSLSEAETETSLGTAVNSLELHENTGQDIGSPNSIVVADDVTPPTIICPEMVEYTNDQGLCSALIPVLFPEATDTISTEFDYTAVRSDGLSIEDPFPVGYTTITWTATDEANNPSLPCDQLFLVIDDELPSTRAQSIIIELDENGLASILAKDLDNEETPSLDNCGIAEYITDRTEFSCADLNEPLQIDFSVIDVNGNTSALTSAMVTVVDLINPTIACDESITVLSSNGDSVLIETLIEPVVTDNCDQAPILNYTRSDLEELNAAFEVGVTTIIWQAVDASGNMTECRQNVTVDFIAETDKSIIAFSIPEQVGETIIDSVEKTIDLLVAVGTDVTALTPVFEVSEFALSNPSPSQVIDFTEPVVYTITVQDGSEQQWTVTVAIEEDTTAPTFEVKGNSENFVTELQAGDSYTVGTITNIVDETATTSDISGDDLVDTTVEGGPFLVTYTVSDGTNETTITETVSVEAAAIQELEILNFTLVNADTNEDILLLEEDMEVNIYDLPTLNLTIRANTTEDVTIVTLNLTGDKVKSMTELVAPFALYGDYPVGQYSGSEFGLGSYLISASAFAKPNLVLEIGAELAVNFSIVEPALSVTSFTLVDGDTNEDLFELTEGMQINVNSIPTMNLNIRSNATADVESVRLILDGDMVATKIEDIAPFALFGDFPLGNYFGAEFGIGLYSIQATPYSENQLSGTMGAASTLNFEIVNGDVTSKNENSMLVYPNPASLKASLTFAESTKLVQVYLYDMLGRMVGSYGGDTIEIDGVYVLNLQSIPSGMYYVKAYDSQGNPYQKQVIVK